MRLNKNFIRIFILSLLIASCGLPDITSIYLEMNQPFITKVISGHNKVTVEFEAQNNEPAFSGYNVYFGDNTNPKKYKLYNQQKALPTISAGSTDTPTKYSYTIEPQRCYYSEGSGEILTLTDSQLPNGIPIYIFVSSYQITPENESSYYYDNYVLMGCPRSEHLNQSVNSGQSITIGSGNDARTLATVSGSGTSLTFQNSTGGIQTRAATSLNDVTYAPADGYTTTTQAVNQNTLYLVKVTDGSDNYYGKIYVRSVSGNSVTVDYCLQSGANITNY